MSQIQQNAAWDSRGYEHARRCAHVQAYAHAGIHGHDPRAAVAVMSRPSWSPWPTSPPSFHWPCLSALVAAAVCVCVCVCVCVYEIHKFKRATLQRTHAHVQHALHTQVRVQHCITAGSSPSSSSGACVSSTSFKFLRSTYVSVTHTPTHMGCVPVRTMTRLFMHADMPEYMEHDPVAPTRFWYLRIRLCSRRGK